MAKRVVPTWYGVYLLDGDRVIREFRAPPDLDSLAEGARRRRAGEPTREELALLAERRGEPWTTGDRRVAGPGVDFDPSAAKSAGSPPDHRLRREMILRAAEEGLESAWDPSIHLEEATRAIRDLDRATNLLGERLASWVARDAPELDPGDGARAAKMALEGTPVSRFGPAEPSLSAARRKLAEAYRALQAARGSLDEAVSVAVPARMPNLDSLLGPELAASLLAQAGGLDRLARLPSSTVQVLGARRRSSSTPAAARPHPGTACSFSTRRSNPRPGPRGESLRGPSPERSPSRPASTRPAGRSIRRSGRRSTAARPSSGPDGSPRGVRPAEVVAQGRHLTLHPSTGSSDGVTGRPARACSIAVSR